MSARWQFRPPFWAWLLTLAGIVAMGQLGLWQLHRGQAKQALQQAFLDADAATAQPLGADEPAAAEAVRKRVVDGEYLADRQLLLDNQTLERRPGYHAWTPLRRDDGTLVLVDRGWLPADPDRRRLPALPAPAGRQRVTGFWRPLPRPGLQRPPEPCRADDFPRVVQYPRAEDLACHYPGARVAAGLLLLAPQDPGGFERRWQFALEVPPEKHYGYALQWFAFALTALILFIKLNLKRR